MNLLLFIGLLLLLGYTLGWVLEKVGLPKIIGYIALGILFSPQTLPLLEKESIFRLEPLMEVSLAFIAFEVGGALKWARIRRHEKEILHITLLASLFPYFLIAVSISLFGWLFPTLLSYETSTITMLALLLGALASSTAPAATIAVMHQYKTRGKVADTILGVVALDDALGIILLTLTVSLISILGGPTSAHV